MRRRDQPLSDWLVLLPIYYSDGRLVGWAAMLGHMSDVGGKVPGSLPTDATSIFEEGMLAPPIKIYRERRAAGGPARAGAQSGPDAALESQRFERDRRRLPYRRTPRRSRCATASASRPLRLRDGSLARTKPARDGRADRAAIPEEEMVFEDYVCDDGRGYGPTRLRCSMRRDGRAGDARLAPAPIRNPRAR